VVHRLVSPIANQTDELVVFAVVAVQHLRIGVAHPESDTHLVHSPFRLDSQRIVAADSVALSDRSNRLELGKWTQELGPREGLRETQFTGLRNSEEWIRNPVEQGRAEPQVFKWQLVDVYPTSLVGAINGHIVRPAPDVADSEGYATG